MTVVELIKQLQSYPPDISVFVEGYEWGYELLEEAQVNQIAEICRDGCGKYGGDYEIYKTPAPSMWSHLPKPIKPKTQEGIILSRLT